MNELDRINLINNEILGRKKKLANAFEILSISLLNNDAFFKKVKLNSEKNELTFELYSLKIKINYVLNLQLEPKYINNATIITSIANSKGDYELNKQYDIIVDKLGNFDNSYTVEEFSELYMNKVVLGFYKNALEIIP